MFGGTGILAVAADAYPTINLMFCGTGILPVLENDVISEVRSTLKTKRCFMKFKDFMALLHPVVAVAIVFPMLGVVLNMAWQTMQRRQQIASGDQSKIRGMGGTSHKLVEVI